MKSEAMGRPHEAEGNTQVEKPGISRIPGKQEEG